MAIPTISRKALCAVASHANYELYYDKLVLVKKSSHAITIKVCLSYQVFIFDRTIMKFLDLVRFFRCNAFLDPSLRNLKAI
jgi:hypothetical protein